MVYARILVLNKNRGMAMEIIEFDKDRSVWDDFVRQADNGTIFHEQKFLSYHGDRLRNDLMIYEDKKLIAVIPLIIEKDIAKSPYGGSYGGFSYRSRLGYEKVEQLYQELFSYLSDKKVKELQLTLTPNQYFTVAESYQTFTVLKLAETRYIPQLTSACILHKDIMQELTSNVRKKIRKGMQLLKIRQGSIDEFYDILMDNMKFHKSKPTHTKDELKKLKNMYPENIIIDIGVADKPVVGNLYFVPVRGVILNFYASQLTSQRNLKIMEAMLYYRMELAAKSGFRLYDYGTSSHKDMKVNYGLTKFKESLGCFGVLRNNFIIKIK